jgi:hypothetical protein
VSLPSASLLCTAYANSAWSEELILRLIPGERLSRCSAQPCRRGFSTCKNQAFLPF